MDRLAMSKNRHRYNIKEESTYQLVKPGQRSPLDVARMSETKDFRP